MALLSSIVKSILPITILPQVQPFQSIYDIPFLDINGDETSLAKYKGKHLLLVNTASKCGFTYQYEALQKLQEQFPDLQIVGFPCNQFKKQEPGTSKDIAEFCGLTYGIKFPLSEKLNVKGEKIHPIYQWLTQKEKNGVLDSTVEWNFQKYWVDKSGALRCVIYTRIKPDSPAFLKTANSLIDEKY